jgi:hypothetical protein
MVSQESDCSVLSESRDDFQSDLDLVAAASAVFLVYPLGKLVVIEQIRVFLFSNMILARTIISRTIIVLVMATMNPRNLIRYVLPLLLVLMCTCHEAVCKNFSLHCRRMRFEI